MTLLNQPYIMTCTQTSSRVDSTGAKKIFSISLVLLNINSRAAFLGGRRTSPAVTFAPPTLTLPLEGGGKGGGEFRRAFFCNI